MYRSAKSGEKHQNLWIGSHLAASDLSMDMHPEGNNYIYICVLHHVMYLSFHICNIIYFVFFQTRLWASTLATDASLVAARCWGMLFATRRRRGVNVRPTTRLLLTGSCALNVSDSFARDSTNLTGALLGRIVVGIHLIN